VAARIRAGERVGPAISYSGYREGQSPDTGTYPSRDEVLEDLRILQAHWRLIRIYGSDAYSERILDVIRREGIDLKVMLGVWLAKEPGHESFNAAQVENGIRLANEYAEIVFAVNVGNEVRVHWTAHPVPEDTVIDYIRKVKSHVPMPVTLADNYAWWVSDGARVAEELDFLTVHTYPVWERRGIDEGLPYTVENYEAVRAALPGKPIVIGEAGWPSYTEGNLHVPRAGSEQNQKRYYEELTKWAKQNGVTVFFFEAFDEPWKGTGTEGHWGFFSVDRKAKLVMRDLYPDRLPDGPTSPTYHQRDAGPEGITLDIVFPQASALRMANGTANFHGAGIVHDRVREGKESQEGSRCLVVPFNGQDWGGVYFLFDTVDVSEHSGMRFSLRIPDSVAALELKIEGPQTAAQSVNLLDYRAADGVEGWGTFLVPFNVFDHIDFTQLAVVGLWNPMDETGAYVAGEMRVNEIRFD
jgi:exo-beta-1,3-glucanase (GH17 family)